jgi:type II secretory pathway component PulF
MALYSYEAFSKDGKKIKGLLDASSPSAVKEQLVKQGLYPINIELAKEQARLSLFSRIFSRSVPIKDKIMFTKQFSVLLKSGVPLVQAIELLTDQFEGKLHGILIAVKDDVKQGTSLADALAKYPSSFENIYIQLVRAGEASGKLEVILDRLQEYMERSEALRKKIKGAMTQPIIQMVVAVLVVIFLIKAVVPQISKVFVSMKIELPGLTLFLLSFSDIITNYWMIILVLLIAAIMGFRYWKNSDSGGRTWDAMKLKMPVIKYLAKTTAVVQFSYTLGMLLEAGVNLSQALDIVVSITDNRVLKAALSEARDKIIKQGKITQYLQQSGVFPPMAIYLIRTGEESGQLDAMLLLVGKNYEAEARELTDQLTGLVSPIMLAVMGALVGVIVLSIMGPMMKMMDSMKF